MARPMNERTETLSGYARVARRRSTVRVASTTEQVGAVLADAGSSGLIARGLGRSYGDAALNGPGIVLDGTALDEVLSVDAERGTVDAQGGVSFSSLLELLLPLGWTLPVLPATRHVTVGGAIAADVHGKNHCSQGTIGRHLERFTLCTPKGTVLVDRRSDPELFAATTGGMGLTGVVVDARLRLVPAATSSLIARSATASSLDELLSRLETYAETHEFVVGWIDGLARGPRLGRGVAVGADASPAGALADPTSDAARAFRPRHWGRVPRWAPRLLHNSTVSAVNGLWLRRASRRATPRPVSLDTVLMPLDAVAGWNRLYGRRGFVQYHFVVPDSAAELIEVALERLERARCFSYFTTLKRLGAASDAPLSFPMPGWSLSLDLPAGTEHLATELDELDELVAGAGGRVYLAKDSRLRPEAFGAMYPDVARLREVCARVDPDGVMQSDLSRRLRIR
jgi:decaprenylphospho-beta-D-ribofuranose 2-oxidase